MSSMRRCRASSASRSWRWAPIHSLPDRGHYGWAQGLLRTVAYELLSRRERKTRHLAAAAYLRQAFANDGEEVAEVIASHHLAAYACSGRG